MDVLDEHLQAVAKNFKVCKLTYEPTTRHVDANLDPLETEVPREVVEALRGAIASLAVEQHNGFATKCAHCKQKLALVDANNTTSRTVSFGLQCKDPNALKGHLHCVVLDEAIKLMRSS